MAVQTVAMAGLGTAPLLVRQGKASTFARSSPRPSLAIRAGNDPLSSVKEAVESSKVPITREQVERTQQLEKNSVVGTVPARGSTLGRPEVERRPETGKRDLFNFLAFDGPGPETVNGRLAMIGVAWAFAAERMTGLRISEQVAQPQGLFLPLAAFYVITWASLVPLFNGESPDSRKNGPFNAKAERWNGRLAMVGFAGILLWEVVFNRALFA